MRLFDSLDDVKVHLYEQRLKAEQKVAEIAAQPLQTGPGSQAALRQREHRIGIFQGQYSAYEDALQALDEIKPGVIAAFERGEVHLIPKGDHQYIEDEGATTTHRK